MISSAHGNVGTDGSVNAGSDCWDEDYIECSNASGASRTTLIFIAAEARCWCRMPRDAADMARVAQSEVAENPEFKLHLIRTSCSFVDRDADPILRGVIVGYILLLVLWSPLGGCSWFLDR